MSPRPRSQAPHAMVFMEQRISLVRIWLRSCECHAEVPRWKSPAEDCCFLASAKPFLWASPHLYGVLDLSEVPARSPACLTLWTQKSHVPVLPVGVLWLEVLGVRGSVAG